MNPTTAKLFGQPEFTAERLVEQTVDPLDSQVAVINDALQELLQQPNNLNRFDKINAVLGEDGEAPEGYQWQFTYRPGMRVVSFGFKQFGDEEPAQFSPDSCRQLRLNKDKRLVYSTLDIVPGAIIMYEESGPFFSDYQDVDGVIIPFSDIDQEISPAFDLVQPQELEDDVQPVHIQSTSVRLR